MSTTDPYAELNKQLTAARERFATDVEGANMTVLKDDEAYRHLRFDFPRASWRWCEVVTWPDVLVLRGGLGCWTFTGGDLVELFRPEPNSERVNPQYWEQRLAPGNRAREYSRERAVAYIRETVDDLASDFPGLADDVHTDLLDDIPVHDLSTKPSLRAALARFVEMHGHTYEGLEFPVEQWDLERYTPWFLLSCVTLPWTVEQYDSALTPAK